MSYFNVDRGNVWKFSVLRGNDWGFSISRGNTWKFVVGIITDRTAPILQSLIIPADGLTIRMTYDENLDTNSVPVVSDFGIGLLAGVVVDAVAISGTVVILTLSRTILQGEVLTLGYFAGTNPIQDDYGNQAANISNQAVTNNSTVDGDVPVFQSGIIPADGLTLAMTYDEALDEGSVPAFGDFSLSGTSSVVDSVGVSGSVVTLTMDTAILQGETVLLSYTAGANPIRDISENNAANLTNQATTNNSTESGKPAIFNTAIGDYDYLTDVLVDGSNFVYNWQDLTVNNNDQLQPLGTSQPLLTVNGILYDGIDNFLQALFTFEQPCFYMMVIQAVSYSNGDAIFDGGTGAVSLRQLGLEAATVANGGIGKTGQMPTGANKIVTCSFNGAAGFWEVNGVQQGGTNLGTNDPGGFTLGALRNGIVASHILAKAVSLWPSTLSTGEKQEVYDYYNTYYSLGL